MKKLTTVLALSSALFIGCVPIQYTRSVTVHKDANGNITGTDETERFTEPHNEMPKISEVHTGQQPFKYLK